MNDSWYETSMIAAEHRRERLADAEVLRSLPRRPLRVLGVAPALVFYRLLAKMGEVLSDMGCRLQTSSEIQVAQLDVRVSARTHTC